MKKWMNEKFMPAIMKFVNTRPMTALKNGMLFSLPFLMVGSIFLIFANFPVEVISKWVSGTMVGDVSLANVFMKAYNATMNLSAMFAVIGIAYAWTEDAGFAGLPAGLLGLVSMLILNPSSMDVMNASGTKVAAVANDIIVPAWLGGKGMITAILVGMFVGGIYTWFLKKNIVIKLPDSVPSNVAQSFTALIPAAVIIVVVTLAYALIGLAGQGSLVEMIYKWIQTPLQHATDGWTGVAIITLLPTFFWAFGIHGTTIIGGIMGPLLTANALENAAISGAHKLTTSALTHAVDVNGVSMKAHIVTQAFMDQFITVTGTGLTIGLTFYLLFFAKSQQMKIIGRLEIGPALFNINEPLLFGTPVVLNPLLIVPFIVTPFLAGAATYLLIQFGILPPLNGATVPWTTPAIFSGLVVGGWKFAVWQFIELALTTFLYWPFAARYDKILKAQEDGETPAEIEEDMAEGKEA
ncbi:MAG: PTS sugar transporter subunit IIC [Lactobacillaceae bacterium]|jgi:PTS system cellobiose-specific IIC component|nr:PTS sugar transporter subunit IIC [Lactobacillaceae bacterium]